MAKQVLQTAYPISIDRNYPIKVFADTIKALEASGVVDTTEMWDQLVGWTPRCLWTPKRTPMARAVPDLDSYADWYSMVGYMAAIAPTLGSVISLDTLRRGPAELTQTMMTLANITEGKSTFHMGAGEIKQIQPYGWDIKQKMGRLEDFYKIFDAFRNNNKTPVSYEGKFTTLDNAWLGVARPYTPKIWGIGGGPKIIDMATTYADGFATMGVMVWSNPEHAAAEIKSIKALLTSKGRDPNGFGFGAYMPCLVHEDEKVLDNALNHDLMRWHATIWGRINQGDWDKEGLPAPMGKDWHYANQLLPMRIGEAEAEDMISRATRKHVEKSVAYGTPKQVAEQIQAYVDAGVTWVGVNDILPSVLEPEDAMNAFQRTIEVCRLLKQKNKD